MNQELIKRILSSIVLIPMALFFIIKGSFLFIFFISTCFCIISYEWHMMRKKKSYYFYGLGFLICGHNIKNFDLPYIAKRMVVNNIKVPTIIPNYKIKPWESRVLDTKEIWNFNSYRGLSSLELVCAVLKVPNPKDNEVNGANLHSFYWNGGDDNMEDKMKKIKKYCEEDVKSLIKFVQKINNGQ